MKSGFKTTLNTVLRLFGMKTDGTVGTVISNSNFIWSALNSMGYRVERGLEKSNYDYVVLSQGKSTLENIILALTKVDYGCIVVFRFNECGCLDFDVVDSLGGFSFYEYAPDKFFGVLLKRKDNG